MRPRLAVAALAAIVMVAAGAQGARGQQRAVDDPGLTYTHGQPVVPVYHGFETNADGTFTLHFGYVNRNWQEELDIPVGANNNVTPQPFGPDSGQPTHFLPRNNRWQFTVRVPADWGSRDVVWTLTSHGHTYQAFGNLKSGYALDAQAIARVYAGGSPEGNKAPTVQLEGSAQRTAKVGEPITLAAVVTDDGIPKGPRPRGRATAASGGGTLRVAQGLSFVWFQFRGAGAVTFTPAQFHAWEDERWNSPYAYGWPLPPVPAGNRWVVQASFPAAGTYVLRGRAFDGGLWTSEDVTVVVTP
jgi:hypothetical protein